MEKFGPSTIYLRGEMFGCISRIECRWVQVEIVRWAQYPAAVKVTCLPKSKRKPRCFVQGYEPSLVVLDGHGHVEPDGLFLPLGTVEAGQSSVADDSERPVIVHKSRYSACAPEWTTDFDAKLSAYLEKSGARVLADFRQHNPNIPYPVVQTQNA